MKFEQALEIYENIKIIKTYDARINQINNVLKRDDVVLRTTNLQVASSDGNVKVDIAIEGSEIWSILELFRDYLVDLKAGKMLEYGYF